MLIIIRLLSIYKLCQSLYNIPLLGMPLWSEEHRWKEAMKELCRVFALIKQLQSNSAGCNQTTCNWLHGEWSPRPSVPGLSSLQHRDTNTPPIP